MNSFSFIRTKTSCYGVLVLISLLLYGCKGGDQPSPGGISFTIDGGTTVEGVANAVVSTLTDGDLISISFVNLEYSLSIYLGDTPADPLVGGKEFVIENAGQTSGGVVFGQYLNGFPDADEIYNLLLGTITVPEFDKAGKTISVEFDVVVQNLIDPSKELTLSGSMLQVSILE